MSGQHPGPQPAGGVPHAGAVPAHVAIIMDGNNRWAKQRKLSEVAAGHKAGVETIRSILEACETHGVAILTLFAFSSENWLRPRSEVEALMALFSGYLTRETPELHRRNIRMRFIGRRDRFSRKIQQKMAQSESITRDNSGGVLVIAADYGGKWDIAEAARSIAREVAAGELGLDDVDEQLVDARVCLADLPRPDLLIRTGGDHRISNFLLWQCAYAEFYFTEKYWPDFTEADFLAALRDFSRRERRFGKTSEQVLDG
ncbi:MAG: polyprenyl diphosphate synthase [Rubrivivax sp.]|nr:polyprenyl diphosphate synthase [Rubrivivax sp.]